MNDKRSRREFISLGLHAGLLLPFAGTALLSCNSKAEPRKSGTENKAKKLNILILGGTSFLGPHQIAYALQRGHSITTFTRGKTKPTVHKFLFNNVEQLTGDRENDLTALQNRKWDAVIDNSGRRTAWTKDSAALLKENAELYLYTSSTGVYYPYLKSNYKEDAEVLLVEPEELKGEELNVEYRYGVMKATSENAARETFGADRTIVVRPTYMAGPADRSNRFVHWPVRLSKGGEVLVPGKVNDPVQYIDVRDVAEWMIRLIEEKNTGTFNAVGPATSQTIYSFAEEAKNAFDVPTTFVKIDDYDFLRTNYVRYIVPWIMPEGNNTGSATINNEKGKANGLTFRPLVQTVKDTHEWWYSDAVAPQRRKGFETGPASLLMRERSIIEKWKSL